MLCVVEVGRSDSLLLEFGLREKERGLLQALMRHLLDLFASSHKCGELRDVGCIFVLDLLDA